MASVNKTSLRQEFESLKVQVEDLKKNKKLSTEAKLLFHSFIVLFEILIAVFMEKKTGKNSSNSSLPPSQTGKDNSSTNKTSNGKGKRQNKDQFPGTTTKVTIEKAEVNFCGHCGEDIKDIPCSGSERRTLIDIFFEKRVTHVDAEIKDCPFCHERTKGWFPSMMRGPLQYGNGLKAFILNLVIAQMVSVSRVQKMIESLIHKAISEATIMRYILKMHLSLHCWEQKAIEELLKCPSIHCDETSMKVNSKNYWVHLYSSGDITLMFIHEKRGGEAIEDIGIIPKYGGVVIHDCWASYLSYGNCDHALCGSHLLRELKFIQDSNDYRWATNMKFLLQETAAKVSARKRKKLTPNECIALQKRYRNILTRGKNEMPKIVKNAKTRGRVAKSDAHNLWERLQKYESSVLMFAKYDFVAFTNNRAEQDLRMNKVKQKVSGHFRKDLYAQAYCRITSYLKSKANEGINPMIALYDQLVKSDELKGRE